jgi:hypothetical protein
VFARAKCATSIKSLSDNGLRKKHPKNRARHLCHSLPLRIDPDHVNGSARPGHAAGHLQRTVQNAADRSAVRVVVVEHPDRVDDRATEDLRAAAVKRVERRQLLRRRERELALQSLTRPLWNVRRHAHHACGRSQHCQQIGNRAALAPALPKIACNAPRGSLAYWTSRCVLLLEKLALNARQKGFRA